MGTCRSRKNGGRIREMVRAMHIQVSLQDNIVYKHPRSGQIDDLAKSISDICATST